MVNRHTATGESERIGTVGGQSFDPAVDLERLTVA
jgi:hypothetical protein